MATKLFPKNDSTTEPVAYLPLPTSLVNSTVSIGGLLSTTQGSSSHAQIIPTAAGPATRFSFIRVSPPLTAGVTISSTVTLNVRGAENSMSANIGARVEVYRVNAATGTLSAQLLTTPNFGTEFGTSESANNWTSAITSTAFNRGDRILVAFGFTDTGGTQASGFTGTLWEDGAAGATGDSWISFTETLTFETPGSAPAGTTVYLTNTASDISTADNDLTADFSRGSGSTTATRNPGAGPVSATQFQTTGTNVRWYTGQLSAVTLTGRVEAHLWSTAGANLSALYAIKVFKRDTGGTETDIAYGVCAQVHSGAAYIGNVGADAVIYAAISDSVSLADGDRLGFIVYTDDYYSGNHTNSSDTLSYSGTSGGAAGDTYVIFNQTLSAFTPASYIPRPRVYPQLLAQ